MTHDRMPPGPEVLDALARQAKDYALHMMRMAERVPPPVIADTNDGYIFRIPGPFTDDAAKDRFTNVARLVALGHDVCAQVLVAEAWASLPDVSGHLDTETPPFQSSKRGEIVALILEDGSRQGSMLIPIVRGWNGSLVAFSSLRPEREGRANS